VSVLSSILPTKLMNRLHTILSAPNGRLSARFNPVMHSGVQMDPHRQSHHLYLTTCEPWNVVRPFNLISVRYLQVWSRVSSGSIVSDYGLEDRAIGVRSPAGAKDFSSSLCVQTGSGAHPVSCIMGTGGPFPGGKSAAGAWRWPSPPSSAEVENE
jgi:hypothetical protein